VYDANEELVNIYLLYCRRRLLEDLVGVGVEDRSDEPMFCASGEDGVKMQGEHLSLGTANDDLYTGDI